jgi:RNA polymerase sigma-70 factor (ECF subfamily)
VKAADTHRAIEAVWRIESPRIIATRMVHDVGLAEELAQDALVAAAAESRVCNGSSTYT